MFESIKTIGEFLLSESQSVFDIAPLKVRKTKGKELLLVQIIFDLDNKKLDCDPLFGCNEERAKEFLWVGNAKGQKPQLVLTTDNPEYLLNPEKGNKWAIGQILEEINRRNLKDREIIEFYEILCRIKGTFFAPPKSLVKKLAEILEEKTRGGQVALYTISVIKNSKKLELVKTQGYQKFLQYVLYETGELMKGRCHICGEEKEVLFEPAYPEGSMLCIYNVDKIGFISDLKKSPENLLKTHAVCIDCKRKLRLGLRYIERDLKATIGRLNVFVIPTFTGVQKSSEIFMILPKLRDIINIAMVYEELEKVEKILEDYKKHIAMQPFIYMINMLFGRPESSHFAYQHLVQNVPVTRLIEIEEEFVKLSKKFMKIFSGDSNLWSMNFTEIYRIFPLRVSRGNVEWKNIIELFDAMLSGHSYPTDELVRRAVLLAKIHRYGTYELYNIPRAENQDLSMCKGLLKHILLLNVLRNMGVVRMKTEILKEIDIPDEEIRNFLKEQKFEEWQAALLLLGVLVGKIGIEQYKKGDETKSVLDKIGFDGTPAERIKVLANYVIKGLRDYKILYTENEKLYGCMKMLLDRNLEKLQNPVDNTFYILSGYAYITMKAITSGGSV